jgi:hypothetical protein
MVLLRTENGEQLTAWHNSQVDTKKMVATGLSILMLQELCKEYLHTLYPSSSPRDIENFGKVFTFVIVRVLIHETFFRGYLHSKRIEAYLPLSHSSHEHQYDAHHEIEKSIYKIALSTLMFTAYSFATMDFDCHLPLTMLCASFFTGVILSSTREGTNWMASTAMRVVHALLVLGLTKYDGQVERLSHF